MSLKGPDFLIVGAPKAGTTSLHNWLAQHPEVFMPDNKEPHYFCADFHEQSDRLHGERRYFPIRDERAYLELFAGRGEGQVAGESSTSSLYSHVAAERIRDFRNDARIVVLLRDPVDLIYSFHAYLLVFHEETVESFREALDIEEPRRRGEIALPPRVRHPSRLYYSEIGRLADQVERYTRLFPREQILLLLFDDLKADGAGTYRRVLRFLGVEESFVPEFTVDNVNRTNRYRWATRLKADPNARFKLVAQRWLPRLYRGVGRTLNRINARRRPRPPLDPGLRSRLQASFVEQVRGLSELVGRDLVQLWGYDREVLAVGSRAEAELQDRP